MDCKISMFKMIDKTLVGKNSLPFESLTCSSYKNSSFYIFSGISGKISLLTSKLSYLGDFQTSSNWIWDLYIDNKGRIEILTK